MRIVLVGNHSVSHSSESHYTKTLESMGHKVIRLQESKVKGDEILAESLRSQLLVFVHTHGKTTPGTPLSTVFAALKAANIPTMTYHLDLWLGISRQRDLRVDPFYKTIGHFFATDKLMADWFNEHTRVKGHYLPAGVYDKEAYMATPNQDADGVERPLDVIFVGAKNYHREWQYRPQLVSFLEDNYRGRFTHVGGDGSTGVVRGAELNQIYANSKIAVGDTLCLNFDYPYYFSDRLFESTGRGGFTIFPYIKGIEDNFVIDKEIITYEYGNFAQLKEKIDYYLIHDEEREKIRLAGHNRTKNEHTYRHRWEHMLKELGL
jgi:hypothetical protein